jgi:hypothetical protein
MTIIDHDKYGNSEEFIAAALSQKDLGSLVMVTLPSGATIQDILVGVLAHSQHRPDEVLVIFEHVKAETQNFTEGSGSWELDPQSTVWAERPLDG